MRYFILCFLIFLPGPVVADVTLPKWQLLDGDQIGAALTDRQLAYESGARQDFPASGRTLYTAGRDSWGYWRVEGDEYCSQWPPSDLWSCYRLYRIYDSFLFVGEQGDKTVATYEW